MYFLIEKIFVHPALDNGAGRTIALFHGEGDVVVGVVEEKAFPNGGKLERKISKISSEERDELINSGLYPETWGEPEERRLYSLLENGELSTSYQTWAGTIVGPAHIVTREVIMVEGCGDNVAVYPHTPEE